MKKIEKKILPKYFQAIIDGKKNFELRLADFEVDEGDVLLLREWGNINNNFTGREIEKEIKYIVKTKDINFLSEEEINKNGFQILGF